MAPDRVMECLTAYKAAIGRCGHLKVEIERLSKILREVRASTVEDACIGAQQYAGMPHGSGIGDPTARIGGRFADGYRPAYIKELQNEICLLQDEYAEDHRVVRYVDSWLKCLSDAEQFVIKQQVVYGRPWQQVCDEYQNLIGGYISKATLKRIKDRALCRIYEVAQ